MVRSVKPFRFINKLLDDRNYAFDINKLGEKSIRIVCSGNSVLKKKKKKKKNI